MAGLVRQLPDPGFRRALAEHQFSSRQYIPLESVGVNCLKVRPHLSQSTAPTALEFGPANCWYPAERLRSGSRHSVNQSSDAPVNPA